MIAHGRAHIGEHAYENPHMRAHTSTHMRSQEREPHFVRAFRIESPMDMSRAPLCIAIYRKNAGLQSRDTRFVRACAVETHMDTSEGFEKSHFVWNFTRKKPHPNSAAHVLYCNLQGKTHMDISEEPFCMENFMKNLCSQ